MRPHNRILDVIQFNDELAMLRYRLAVHEPIALRTVIIESRDASSVGGCVDASSVRGEGGEGATVRGSAGDHQSRAVYGA